MDEREIDQVSLVDVLVKSVRSRAVQEPHQPKGCLYLLRHLGLLFMPKNAGFVPNLTTRSLEILLVLGMSRPRELNTLLQQVPTATRISEGSGMRCEPINLPYLCACEELPAVQSIKPELLLASPPSRLDVNLVTSCDPESQPSIIWILPSTDPMYCECSSLRAERRSE